MSRRAVLAGLGGLATAAGISGLRFAGSRTGEAGLARSAYLDGPMKARVTVDLWHPTGKWVQPHIYGYATGDLNNNDWLLAANGVVESSAEILAPPLIRFNTSESSIIQSVFTNGVGQPDWTHLARWEQYHSDFLGSNGRLVFGLGPNDANTSLSPAIWAEYASTIAQHFREINQEVTYWEVGNECDVMGVGLYSQYFNAMAGALHSVNADYLVGGPVSSYWDALDLPAFVGLCGRRLGFIDFHSYLLMDGNSTQTAFERAASFNDVSNARKAVAGTVAADLPIGLLEYNMNGFPQPNGTYGDPAQGTITGAVYIALLLTRAFDSDHRFTMGGLWDLLTDSYYGAIGNAWDSGSYRAIDEQGWYLREAARLMPGQQAGVVSSGSDLQVIATASELRFSLQFVNFNLERAQSVATEIIGRQPGTPVRRWELSARYPAGHSSAITSVANVPVPAQSIVILNGQRHLRK